MRFRTKSFANILWPRKESPSFQLFHTKPKGIVLRPIFVFLDVIFCERLFIFHPVEIVVGVLLTFWFRAVIIVIAFMF